MKGLWYLGTTPSKEHGVQVNDVKYYRDAGIEARTYIGQLKRTYGENPIGSLFNVVKRRSDRGVYRKIIFRFDDQNQQHVKYALMVESGCERWDKQALKELKQNRYEGGTRNRYDQQYQLKFGANVRFLREARNWTQLDLSVYSGVNETQISKIENGEVGPNLQTIRAIAVALGVYPKDLLDFEYLYELNSDFSSRVNSQNKNNTTALIRELVSKGFFDTHKEVSVVIEKCKLQYGVVLPSDDTSGVLLMLVRQNVLTKSPSSKGKNRYQVKK